MTRIKFTRPRKRKEEALVCIRHGRFHFNAFFARVAQLEKMRYVVYHLDEENREITFEFLKDKSDQDAFSLVNLGGERKFPSKFTCAAKDLIAKNLWIRQVADADDRELRTFRAVPDGKLWTIRLIPSFEAEVLRVDASKIAPGVRGIYRYISNDGKIVYIGKGNVRKRLSDPERRAWAFDKIQYSRVRDESEQYKWERFWLGHYSEAHGGRVPYYNRQGGNKG